MFRFGLFWLLWKIEWLFMLFSGFSMVWLCLRVKVFSVLVLWLIRVGGQYCGNSRVVSFLLQLCRFCGLLIMQVLVVVVMFRIWVLQMYLVLIGGFLCISMIWLGLNLVWLNLFSLYQFVGLLCICSGVVWVIVMLFFRVSLFGCMQCRVWSWCWVFSSMVKVVFLVILMWVMGFIIMMMFNGMGVFVR